MRTQNRQTFVKLSLIAAMLLSEGCAMHELKRAKETIDMVGTTIDTISETVDTARKAIDTVEKVIHTPEKGEKVGSCLKEKIAGEGR